MRDIKFIKKIFRNYLWNSTTSFEWSVQICLQRGKIFVALIRHKILFPEHVLARRTSPLLAQDIINLTLRVVVSFIEITVPLSSRLAYTNAAPIYHK